MALASPAHLYNALKRPVVLLTASRYFGYVVTFVRGMLVAKVLGPEMLGVWGFLTLVSQYLDYTSCGVEYAVTVDLATKSRDNSTRTISAAMTFVVIVLGLLVLVSFASRYWGFSVLEKYHYREYALAVAVVVGLRSISGVLVNVYRVYQGFGRIAAAELLGVSIPLLAVLVFPADRLIYALLGAMAVSALLGIALLMIRAPFAISLGIDLPRMASLLIAGVPLLIYNMTSRLVTDSGRVVLSVFYSVQAMGYYSFANSITSATFLGLKAVVWVVFPSVLSKTHSGVADAVAMETVREVTGLYRTAVFLVMFGAIVALPLLFFFFPEYERVEGALTGLLLAQAVGSIAFGHVTMAIARGRYGEVASISMASAVVSAALGVLVAASGLALEWIAAASLVGMSVSVLLQIRLGQRLLNGEGTGRESWRDAMPLGSVVAVLVCFAGSFTGYGPLAGALALVVFVVTSRRELVMLFRRIVRLGSKP